MLLVVGHCLEADLGTTSTEDLEVVADVGGQEVPAAVPPRLVAAKK